VEWSVNDDENPRNWPNWRKAIRISLAIFQAVMIHSGAFILIPSLAMIRNLPQADDSLELAGFALSAHLVGFAAGPLLWRPLSTLIGSRLVDLITGAGFGALTLSSLAPVPLAAFIVLRFYAGVFGGGALANGPTIIDDLLRRRARSVCQTLYLLGQFAGFIIGPVVARLTSLTASEDHWRYLLLIPGVGVLVSVAVLGMLWRTAGETYAPVLLEARASGLRNRHSNNQYRSRYDTGLTPWQSFRQKAAEPLKLLFTEKECAGYAAFAGLLYGVQYFILTTM
ncbi:major facilitator superfamily domain-containing protein, partial [Chaetomium fimeti]